MSKASQKLWIGFGLPGRETDATYSTFRYEAQPEVKPFPKLQDIKTLDDLKKHLPVLVNEYPFLNSSPTSCYWSFDGKEPGVFFRDQQDCVVWCLDEKTGEVFVPGFKKSVVVAASLPEFMTRIALENEIWLHTSPFRQSQKELSNAAKAYMKHFEDKKE